MSTKNPSTGRKLVAALGTALTLTGGSALPTAPVAQGPNTVKQSQARRPWDAPRYNQRKARKLARRMGRRVVR